MLKMVSGYRTDAVVRKKLIGIKHSPQERLHAMSAEQREQSALAFTGHKPMRYQPGKIGPVSQKPFQAAAETGNLAEQPGIQSFHGKQWHQAHHGTNLQRHGLASRQIEHVIIKPVLFVPKTYAAAAHIRHRFGDVKKVLKELGRRVVIGDVVLRQFKSDSHQGQAVHRHPTGAIGLAEKGTVGQGLVAIENSDVVQTEEATLKEIASMKIFLIDPPGEVEE